MGNFYPPQNLNGERLSVSNAPVGGNFTLDLNSITSLQIQQDGAQGESISSLTANGEVSLQGLQDLQNLLTSTYPDSTASLALASAMSSLRQQQGQIQNQQPQQQIQPQIHQTPAQGRVSPANTVSSTHSSPSLYHALSSSLAGALGSQPAQHQASTGLHQHAGAQFELSSHLHPHSHRHTGPQNNMSMVGGPVDPDEMELEMEMGTGFVDSSEGSESSSDVHSVHSYPSSTHSSPHSGSEDLAYSGLTSGVSGMNVSGVGIGAGLYRSPSTSQGQGNEGTTLKAEPMIHALANGFNSSGPSSNPQTANRIYTSGAMFNGSPNPPAVPPPTPVTPGGSSTPMGPSAFDTTMILHTGIGPSISDRMSLNANNNMGLNGGTTIKHTLHATSGHPYLSKNGYGGASGFGLRNGNLAFLGRGVGGGPGAPYTATGLAMTARGMHNYGNAGFDANEAFYGTNATESNVSAIKPSLLYALPAPASHGKAKKLSRSASAQSSTAGSAVPSRSHSPTSRNDQNGTPSVDGKHPGHNSLLTTASILSKPFKCPKPGCMKSYKQANGLKYHVTHGSCSFTPPAELAEVEGLSEREAEKRLKPFCCQVPPCQRRYKNMNGLRYHYQHSGEHGAIGLSLLASGNHDATKSQPSPPSISLDTSSGALDNSSGPATPASVIGASLSRANSTSSASIRRGRTSPSSPGFGAYPQSHSQPITPLTPSFGGPGGAHFANSVLSQPPSAYASPWASPRTSGYSALPSTCVPQQQPQMVHNTGAMGSTYTSTTIGGSTSGSGWNRQDLALS